MSKRSSRHQRALSEEDGSDHELGGRREVRCDTTRPVPDALGCPANSGAQLAAAVAAAALGLVVGGRFSGRRWPASDAGGLSEPISPPLLLCREAGTGSGIAGVWTR
jgi:hypothetical protein